MKYLVVAMTFGLLTGCKALQPLDTPPERAAAGCDLAQPNTADCEVTVDAQSSADPSQVCTVTVPDQVVFQGVTGSNPKWVFWRIDPSKGFVFRDHLGIEFKDPRARFSDGKRLEKGAVYRVKNLGKANAGDPAQSWYYGIHLERTNDGMRCGFDPLVRNE